VIQEPTIARKNKLHKSPKKKLSSLQKKLLEGPVMTDAQWKKYLEENPRAGKWKV